MLDSFMCSAMVSVVLSVSVMVSSLSASTGAASLICAETLRQENFGGRIIMVSRDELLPYDKTRLSKVLWRKLHELNTKMMVMNMYVCVHID